MTTYHVHPEAYQPLDRPIGVSALHLRPFLTFNAVEILRELHDACYEPTEAHEACDPRSQ
jgi:hypothetical protein